MQRGSYPPNPYSTGAPFGNGETGFRSPTYPPRFQTSPGPRFHQQYVPHHNGPRRNSPGNYPMRSPKTGGSPYNSPQHINFDSKTPGSQSSSQRSFSSSANSSWSTPSGRGTPHGRFMYNNNGSSRNAMKFSPRNDPNSNPGGSNDITMYYSQDMTQDPWANMKPIPVNKSSFT